VVLRGDHRVPGANSGRARKPTYGTTGLGLNAGRYRQIISSLPLCNTPCQRQARSGGMRAGRQDSFWAQNLSITKPHLSSSTTIFFSWHLGRGPAGHSHHQKDEAHILFFSLPCLTLLGVWGIRPSRGRTQNKSQFPANRGVLTHRPPFRGRHCPTFVLGEHLRSTIESKTQSPQRRESARLLIPIPIHSLLRRPAAKAVRQERELNGGCGG